MSTNPVKIRSEIERKYEFLCDEYAAAIQTFV